METSPLRERTHSCLNQITTPQRNTPSIKGSKFMKTPSKIPSVKKNVMGFTPKSTGSKYRYGQTVKPNGACSAYSSRKMSSPRKESSLFDKENDKFSSRDYLTSFDRDVTMADSKFMEDAASSEFSTHFGKENAFFQVRNDTLQYSESTQHADSIRPFSELRGTPSTMVADESLANFYQKQYSDSHFSAMSSCVQTNPSTNFFDIPQPLLELTDEIEDKRMVEQLNKKFPRKKAQDSFGSEFRSQTDFFSEQGSQMRHRFPDEGNIKINLSKIQENLSMLSSGLINKEGKLNNEPSPEKQLTARFPSMDINSSKIKMSPPTYKQKEEDSLKEIVQQNESKYGSKPGAKVKMFEDSFCDLLEDGSQSKLLQDSLLNCSLSFSDNFDRSADSLTHVRSSEQSIPKITDNPRITISLSKLDEIEAHYDRTIEQYHSKTDRVAVALNNITPKGIRSDLLNPVLRSKQRSPENSKTNSLASSAARMKPLEKINSHRMLDKSPMSKRAPKVAKLNLDFIKDQGPKIQYNAPPKRKSQTPKSRNLNSTFNKFSTKSLIHTSKHASSQKKFNFTKQDLAKLNKSALFSKRNDAKVRPHEFIRHTLRSSVSPLRNTHHLNFDSLKDLESTPRQSNPAAIPHENIKSRDNKYISAATQKRLQRKTSPEKEKSSPKLPFEIQKRVESPVQVQKRIMSPVSKLQIDVNQTIAEESVQTSTLSIPRITEPHIELAAFKIQRAYRMYRMKKRQKLLRKKKLLIESILQAKQNGISSARSMKNQDELISATPQLSMRVSGQKNPKAYKVRTLQHQLSPILKNSKRKNSSPKVQLLSYRGKSPKITEFKLDTSDRSISKDISKKKLQENIEEQMEKSISMKSDNPIAKKLLVHNSLMQSCMASFYSTQMAMWRSIMQHYENKK